MAEQGTDYVPSAAVLAAARRLIPDRDSGIESVTISTAGRSVTLTAEDGEHFDRAQADPRRRPSYVPANRDPEQWTAHQREGIVAGFDPTARVFADSFPVYSRDRFDQALRLRLVESEAMAHVGAALITRHPTAMGALAHLQIAYLWSDDVGLIQGEPRVWRLRKPGPFVLWGLNRSGEDVHFDLTFELSAHVATYGEFTAWQRQAAIHEALSCVRVRNGVVSIKPASLFIRQGIIRRYGEWEPSLQALRAAMELTDTEQLRLFEEGWDESEGEEE